MQARAESRQSVAAEAGDFGTPSASPAADELERDSLVASLELLAARHATCVSEAEQAWSIVEVACEGRVGEAQLAAQERACATSDEVVTLAAQELYKGAADAVEERQEESFQDMCRSYCKDMERAAPFLEASKVARAELWPQALRLAADLEGELAIQGGLQALLREKDRTRRLLAAELGAPGEARRALATVRAALVEGKPLRSPNCSARGYLASGDQAMDDQLSNNLVFSPRRAAGDRALA